MNENDIILGIHDKFGEWLEESGDNAPALMIHILAVMLLKEKEKNEFLQRRLSYGCACSTK